MEAIVIGNEKFKVEVVQNGAELQQLTRLTDGKKYIWTPIETYWNRRAPNLFPIVGRLKNNKYSHNGQSYELGQHGFARNSHFKILSQEQDKVLFKLDSDSNTLEKYPFDFSFIVGFSIVDNVLTVSAQVKNTGEEILPFSYGAHPAFKLNYPMDKYSIAIDNKKEINRRFLNEGIRIDRVESISLQQNQLNLNDVLFLDDAIVLEKQNISKVELIENGNPYITLTSFDNPYYGIWSKPGAQFVCLEPWWGIADSEDVTGEIIEKEGINILAPNSEVSFKYSIEMH